MKCPVCSSPSPLVLEHPVRATHWARLALCPECDLLFVANPNWLAEAYASPINATDIGYVTRNIFLSRKTLILFFLLFGRQGPFVDYAAGYGMLVRLMRDYGLDFFWSDPYTQNLFAAGFEHDSTRRPLALTCFECFEHLPEPLKEMRQMLDMSSTIFFSTRLRPERSVPSAEWEYYGWNHGQHVAFYSERTLRYIAKRHGLRYYTDGANLHLFSKRRLPNAILRIVNTLTKLQLDLPLRKLLRSKLAEDHELLISRGL